MKKLLTPNKQKALQALLTHKTKQEAAQAAGITPRTMTLYLSDPEFQTEYARAFKALVTEATRTAQATLSPAICVLRSIMEDEKETSSSRIAAARSLLEYGLRLTEFNDILEELQTITGAK